MKPAASSTGAKEGLLTDMSISVNRRHDEDTLASPRPSQHAKHAGGIATNDFDDPIPLCATAGGDWTLTMTATTGPAGKFPIATDVNCVLPAAWVSISTEAASTGDAKFDQVLSQLAGTSDEMRQACAGVIIGRAVASGLAHALDDDNAVSACTSPPGPRTGSAQRSAGHSRALRLIALLWEPLRRQPRPAAPGAQARALPGLQV